MRALAASAPEAATWRAATVLGDGDVLVGRYLGRSAERARAFLARHLAAACAPRCSERAAVPPRIWAT